MKKSYRVVCITVRFLLIGLSCLMNTLLNGQSYKTNTDWDAARPTTIFATYSQPDFDGSLISPAYGVKFRAFINKHLSFDTDISIGKGYTHFGLGLLSLPVYYLLTKEGNWSILEARDFTEFVLLFAVFGAALEHTSFHIPIGNHADISPYVSLLREKIVRGHDQLHYALGLEFNMYFKRLVISPFADADRAYYKEEPNNHFRFNVGINCGLYLGKQLNSRDIRYRRK